MFTRATQRFELREYDYRFVTNPLVVHCSFGVPEKCLAAIYYEFVPCSEGERNAIVAWQGGLE